MWKWKASVSRQYLQLIIVSERLIFTRLFFEVNFHANVITIWIPVMDLLLDELIMKFISSSYSCIETYLVKSVRILTT